MDFPAYVPAGARKHIRRTLEGDDGGWGGVDAYIAEYRRNGDVPEALLAFEQERACILRFAYDERMRDVYSELGKVLLADNQYGEFLRAAWAANMNYASFRERIKQAKTLAPQIATAARELASLLEQTAKVGGGVAPSEFYSVRALLDATENHELDGHNLHFWRIVRGAITGNNRERESAALSDDAAAPQRVVYATEESVYQVANENPDALVVVVRTATLGEAVDPKQNAQNMVRYAWEKAPHLPALLETVACAADAWKPQEYGAIGAAIASRKSVPIAEYIRAFAKLLQEIIPDLTYSAPVYAAMAGTSDVVLNNPEFAVTVDTVRRLVMRVADDSH